MTVKSSCVRCRAPAAVCQECVRATALKWFGAVARHPETGTGCQLCENGHASFCRHCFVGEVIGYRTALRRAGTQLGEPSWTCS
ncbi:MAG: hypothetical protein ACRDNS_30185 [Trebonia sp.]